MSDAAWISFFTALPATIAALAAAYVAVVTRQVVQVTSTAAKEQMVVADQKLDHITTLTNSTLTAANARIALLESTVETLIRERNGTGGDR